MILIGSVMGGSIALVPFLSTHPAPSGHAQLLYFGSLGVALALAITCAVAHLAISDQRDDSVAAIREDLDKILIDFGVVAPSPGQAGSETEIRSGIVLVSAKYGVEPDQLTDVTHIVRSLVRDGRLSILASNETLGGDPLPGVLKTLIVDYQLEGKGDLYRFTFTEGDQVDLPPPAH